MAEFVGNFHTQYQDITSQHWSPNSEVYAGCDHLLTALSHRWEIMGCEEHIHWYAGMRSVRLYRFILERDGQEMTMPVLCNPYVERLIIESGVSIKPSPDSIQA